MGQVFRPGGPHRPDLRAHPCAAHAVGPLAAARLRGATSRPLLGCGRSTSRPRRCRTAFKAQKVLLWRPKARFARAKCLRKGGERPCGADLPHVSGSRGATALPALAANLPAAALGAGGRGGHARLDAQEGPVKSSGNQWKSMEFNGFHGQIGSKSALKRLERRSFRSSPEPESPSDACL